MKLPAYPDSKDSGVEWLGEVPAHWEVPPLKYLVINSNAGEVIDRSHWGGDSEKLYTCAINPLDSDYKDFPEKKRTTSSDLLLTRNGTPYVHTPIPGAIYTNVVQRITLDYDVDRMYLAVALQNSADNLKGYGVSIESLNYEMWKALPLSVPPLPEQRAIAAFLDRETGKIDALVAEQERLIELLKEKRQALISHAVTKGLNPDAPMKPSGIEWLGDIPEHWEVCKCGYYVEIIPGYAFPSDEYSHDEADTRLLRGINVGVDEIRWGETVYWRREADDGLSRFELKVGDLVLGLDRPWISEGMRIAVVELKDLPALLLQRVACLRTSGRLHAGFIYRYLSSEMFIAYFSPETTGVSVPHISTDQVADFVLAFPPISEQVEIVNYLDQETCAIDALIAEAEKAMALLRERRTALISAAVTGKIDVRGAVSAEEVA